MTAAKRLSSEIVTSRYLINIAQVISKYISEYKAPYEDGNKTNYVLSLKQWVVLYPFPW